MEDNSPNRESGRVEARRGLRHPHNSTTLGRATNGVAAPLGSSTAAGTAADERRPAVTRIPAEGFTSTRIWARTRMAARAGTRSSDGREGRQKPTEPLHRVFSQQTTMTRLTSSTTPVEPIPSPPEPSPDTPRLPQQASETMQSPAATGPGSPLTTTFPLEGSKVPVIEGSPPSSPPAPQRLPTHSCPTTGTPRLTPGMILALESSTESAARSTQLALPSPSQPTSALTPGGRNSEPAPTSDRPPSPPRSPPQPPAERGQLQDETSEDYCVCYEVLVPPMVNLGSCLH